MKKVLAAAFALLLLLSACQTRPISAPDTTDAEAIDPNEDLRTRDARLAALFAETDGPVVVQFMNWRWPIVLKDQTDYTSLWNAPHVMNVICTALVHWLDTSEEGSLSMIGQYLPDLDPAAIAEGRWYETENECCLNRAEYERLLADPDAHFTGIGDSVRYAEQITELGELFTKKQVAPIAKTFTVVGIVGDEGKYADPAYGIHHMYALTDAVEAMLGNYQANRFGHGSILDEAVYSLHAEGWSHEGLAMYKENPDRPGELLIRYAEDKIYTEEEWMDLFYELPCNAGYTIEVTLDSGKNYADYAEYYRLKQFTHKDVQTIEEERERSNAHLAEELEKKLTEPQAPLPADAPEGTKVGRNPEIDEMWRQTLAPTEQDVTITQLLKQEDCADWFNCYKAPYVIHPLRVGE